ncbi:hypothetical protein BGX27_002177 [Mortierella sp. AM989]|nr:hypothetical protein BGX27_002177 [Mortierella sp. AM989]
MTNSRLVPFDLPLVLEQIGTHLEPKDLLSCTLVCRDWYTQFAPFIWWYILEDCDELLHRIYNKHKNATTKTQTTKSTKITKTYTKKSKINTNGPPFHLETEYMRIIGEYTQKIDNSSCVIHRQRRTRLAYRSFLSFILLGWLCDNIKVINFIFREPPTFMQPQFKNSGSTYNLSDQYYTSQEKPDRIVEIIEKSRRLEELYLEDWGSPVYRWLDRQLNDAMTLGVDVASPRWPNLLYIKLSDCAIDQDFLRILLFNCPSIKHLSLREITIHGRSDFEIFSFPGDHSFGDNRSNSGTDNLHFYPPIQKLALYKLKGVTLRQQMHFASQLPKLESLSLSDEIISFPALLLDEGFRALRSLQLSQRIQEYGGPDSAVIIRTASRIEDLSLKNIRISSPICRAIKGHYACLTHLRELGFAGGVGENAFVVEEGVFLLMKHLDQLEILNLTSQRLETNANLTVEHAELLKNAWPNLQAIKGLYHMDLEEFVECMREHRPEVKLAYV